MLLVVRILSLWETEITKFTHSNAQARENKVCLKTENVSKFSDQREGGRGERPWGRQKERELNMNCRKTNQKIFTTLIIIATCLLLCGQSA